MTVSESPLGDEAAAEEAIADAEAIQEEADLPPLNTDDDNEPDDSSEYVAVETQDREGTERPEVDKHPED